MSLQNREFYARFRVSPRRFAFKNWLVPKEGGGRLRIFGTIFYEKPSGALAPPIDPQKYIKEHGRALSEAGLSSRLFQFARDRSWAVDATFTKTPDRRGGTYLPREIVFAIN